MYIGIDYERVPTTMSNNNQNNQKASNNGRFFECDVEKEGTLYRITVKPQGGVAQVDINAWRHDAKGDQCINGHLCICVGATGGTIAKDGKVTGFIPSATAVEINKVVFDGVRFIFGK
jgi:hypothetical protein